MNNFKNLVILLLSIIILVQSAILLYFLRRPSASRPRPRAVIREEKVKPKPVPEAPASGVLAPSKEPVRPVPGPVPVVSAGKIALVIDDWGYHQKNNDFITGNNYPMTLAILPFRAYSRSVAALALAHDKEVIIHMPMEPHHKEQYGLEENTLLTNMSASQIIRLLNDALEDVPQARGVSNHMGSLATENERLMRIVMSYLKRKNLFFLDSLVTSKSVCRKTALALKVGFASRDVFIDNEEEPAAIRRQVMTLARLAKKRGYAVGIGHDRALTIAVLKEMIPLLKQQGFTFVSISDLISEPNKGAQ